MSGAAFVPLHTRLAAFAATWGTDLSSIDGLAPSGAAAGAAAPTGSACRPPRAAAVGTVSGRLPRPAAAATAASAASGPATQRRSPLRTLCSNMSVQKGCLPTPAAGLDVDGLRLSPSPAEIVRRLCLPPAPAAFAASVACAHVRATDPARSRASSGSVTYHGDTGGRGSRCASPLVPLVNGSSPLVPSRALATASCSNSSSKPEPRLLMAVRFGRTRRPRVCVLLVADVVVCGLVQALAGWRGAGRGGAGWGGSPRETPPVHSYPPPRPFPRIPPPPAPPTRRPGSRPHQGHR
jgi:hypothetical protein